MAAYTIHGWFDEKRAGDIRATAETADTALWKLRGVLEQRLDRVTVTDAAGRQYTPEEFAHAVQEDEIQ
jgi:hypothetical protein